MKKTIIASLAVIASAAVLGTFALDGAGKFGGVRVNAGIKEYSVTFDGSESTTIEKVGDHYAICTTTAAGNKVGVVGYYSGNAKRHRLTFSGENFCDLTLFNLANTLAGRAYEFSAITGFAISFSGEEDMWMNLEGMDEQIEEIESGKEYKGLSIAPSGMPSFMLMEGGATVSSLTIWYSC